MFISILLNSQAHPLKSHPFPEPSPTGNGVSIAGKPLQGSEVRISINGRLVGNGGVELLSPPMKMKIDSLRRKASSHLPTEHVSAWCVVGPACILSGCSEKICSQKYINTNSSMKYKWAGRAIRIKLHSSLSLP